MKKISRQRCEFECSQLNGTYCEQRDVRCPVMLANENISCIKAFKCEHCVNESCSGRRANTTKEKVVSFYSKNQVQKPYKQYSQGGNNGQKKFTR